MDNIDIKHIEHFNSLPASKHSVIAYGGDGELLKVVSQVGKTKSIIPIRNYGRCEKHANVIEEIINGKELKYSKHSFIDYALNGKSKLFLNQKDGPVSEIVWKSANPTCAMRFSVYVNGALCMSQCIADGIVFSTALGSHGYFKSVSRTIFNDDNLCGLGFIAPTYGLCNMVLKDSDQVKISLERSVDTYLSGDKCFKTLESSTGDTLDLRLSATGDGIALFGYDIFCCPDCRKGRNSTLVNDQYAL